LRVTFFIIVVVSFPLVPFFFFFAGASTVCSPLSLHDALPIFLERAVRVARAVFGQLLVAGQSVYPPVDDFHFERVLAGFHGVGRSEEHTSEPQSRGHLVCRLRLAKKKSAHATTDTDSHTRDPI